MKIFENFEIENFRKFRLLGQLFFEIWGSNSIDLILLIRIFPSDRKHSTRNCIKFAHAIFLVLNVDSREEKKKCDCCDTESRNSTRKRSNFVKSHFTSGPRHLLRSWNIGIFGHIQQNRFTLVHGRFTRFKAVQWTSYDSRSILEVVEPTQPSVQRLNRPLSTLSTSSSQLQLLQAAAKQQEAAAPRQGVEG